jgi:hypothetical protein
LTPTIRSPECKPATAAGDFGTYVLHAARGVGRDPEHVDRREQDDREDEIRPGPGRDHGQPFPGALAPVGVRAEGVVELAQAAVGRAPGLRRELGARERLAERRERAARFVEGALGHEPLGAFDIRQQARLLVQRRREVHVQVGRRRPVHARDLHVAAERDHAEAVLDPVARPLDRRGREPDVELPRPHPDPARREEVAHLVDQDQQREAEDGDETAHTGCSFREPARFPVGLDQVVQVPRGAPSTSASVSSTVAAMARKGSRPSRKAATATSLAALKAHG